MSFDIEEWPETHPSWAEFLRCVEEVVPDQLSFVVGEYARHLPCHALVAVADNEVVGFLRFGIQPIGAEEGAAHFLIDGKPLIEAKIHAFAVRESHRRRGIGEALQRRALRLAKELGCHQLSSHTNFEREENCRVKFKLGFAACVDEGKSSVRFVAPLQDTRSLPALKP